MNAHLIDTGKDAMVLPENGLAGPANRPANQSSLASQDSAKELIHEAKVIGECYRIRVLFDTEAQKLDADYGAIVEDTWLKTFRNTDPEFLERAVQEFIVSDKKGYLPKPGQILEALAKGVKVIERRRVYEKIERLERERWIAEMGNQENDAPEKEGANDRR